MWSAHAPIRLTGRCRSKAKGNLAATHRLTPQGACDWPWRSPETILTMLSWCTKLLSLALVKLVLVQLWWNPWLDVVGCSSRQADQCPTCIPLPRPPNRTTPTLITTVIKIFAVGTMLLLQWRLASETCDFKPKCKYLPPPKAHGIFSFVYGAFHKNLWSKALKTFCCPTVYLLPALISSLLCLPQTSTSSCLLFTPLLLLNINSRQKLSIWFDKKTKLISWKAREDGKELNCGILISLCALHRRLGWGQVRTTLYCNAFYCIMLHFYLTLVRTLSLILSPTWLSSSS